MILLAADVLMAIYNTEIAALLILIVFVVKMQTSREMACVFALERKAAFNVQKIVMPIWCMTGNVASHRLVCFRKYALDVLKAGVTTLAQGSSVYATLDTLAWIVSDVWRALPCRLMVFVSAIVG